jgi:hypothetical protein
VSINEAFELLDEFFASKCFLFVHESLVDARRNASDMARTIAQDITRIKLRAQVIPLF